MLHCGEYFGEKMRRLCVCVWKERGWPCDICLYATVIEMQHKIVVEGLFKLLYSGLCSFLSDTSLSRAQTSSLRSAVKAIGNQLLPLLASQLFGKCNFIASWLDVVSFHSWLTSVTNPCQARCFLCEKSRAERNTKPLPRTTKQTPEVSLFMLCLIVNIAESPNQFLCLYFFILSQL